MRVFRTLKSLALICEFTFEQHDTVNRGIKSMRGQPNSTISAVSIKNVEQKAPLRLYSIDL